MRVVNLGMMLGFMGLTGARAILLSNYKVRMKGRARADIVTFVR